MKTIKIKAPFYGAGSPKQYNWVKDGYNMWGIGVKLTDLKENEELEIVLSKIKYKVKTKNIKQFVDKYQSTYSVRNSLVKLGVFSTSLLEMDDKTLAPNVKDFLEKWGENKKSAEIVDTKDKLF